MTYTKAQKKKNGIKKKIKTYSGNSTNIFKTSKAKII